MIESEETRSGKRKWERPKTQNLKLDYTDTVLTIYCPCLGPAFLYMCGEALWTHVIRLQLWLRWGRCLNERRDETRERAGTRQSKQTVSAEEERGSR